MKTQKPLWQKLFKLHLTLLVLLRGFISPSIILSQTTLLTKSEEKPDFSGEGRSGRQTSLDSRGNCPPGAIAALMPTSNWGTTVTEHPALWFYVPYYSQQVAQGEFVLQDKERNDIKRLSFNLPKTPGLVSVKVPISLKISHWYRWYFKIYCQKEASKPPVFVQGWIQRIALTSELENQLKKANLRKDLVYTVNQIWYDAVAELAEELIDNPTDNSLRQAWLKLLSANGVHLERLSQLPLMGSVIFIPNCQFSLCP